VANGEINSFKRVLSGVIIVLITGWLGWISICAIAADREVAVIKSTIIYIQNDVKESKTDIKSIFELVTDIRQDQVRREQKENGKRR
jgi:hypothetical protein